MMKLEQIQEAIRQGEAVCGIELGSTRIKAVLIGPDHTPIATGAFDWENQRAGGVWTYPLEVERAYGEPLRKLGALGFSAMMHGYLPLDKEGNQLCEFRTWRNTITEEEAAQLTELFGFNIPQRWSIAHLYRAIRRKEAHVPSIACLTTLAGYVHQKLTGRSVLGVGEASGVFPIDSATGTYDAAMAEKFDQLVAGEGLPWKLLDILPQVQPAGGDAGFLTEEGPPALWSPARRWLPPKGTPALAWRPPTPCGPAPATSPPAPPCSPWWCWRSPCPRSTRRLTWWPRPTGSRWPWST